VQKEAAVEVTRRRGPPSRSCGPAPSRVFKSRKTVALVEQSVGKEQMKEKQLARCVSEERRKEKQPARRVSQRPHDWSGGSWQGRAV
jgi:hypothetical protein